MEVDAKQVMYTRVHVDRDVMLRKILDSLLFSIRPDAAIGYNDWYIRDDGTLVGVTEYHHGSDSTTNLGKVEPSVIEAYHAIRVVERLARKYPE